MITLKVRYDKNVTLNSRVSNIDRVSIAFSSMLNEGYIALGGGCISEMIMIRTPRDVDQRITFYDSGRKIKEFVLLANSGVKELIVLHDQVKSFYEYTKNLTAIDNLK